MDNTMTVTRWAPLVNEAIEPNWITYDIPPVPGKAKVQPEDFVVDEIPAYRPSGEGEHLFLWIEKRNVSAEFLLRAVARRLKVPLRSIGCAGLKDKVAITRQYISVPRVAEKRLRHLEREPGIKILEVRPHQHKLRTSHLKGNIFRILLRGTPKSALPTVRNVLDRLRRQGMPNFYGRQRFGRGGDTALTGLGMISGDIPNDHIVWRDRIRRKLYLSAAQAAIYNAYLRERIARGWFRRVLDGDVMHKDSGGIFFVTDVEQEQRRFDQGYTVHAGPIFGKKMFKARGTAAEFEHQVLRRWDLDPEWFVARGRLLMGTRRPNLVYPQNVSVEVVPEGLVLSFTLAPGSFATVLLEEILKKPIT